MNPRLVIDKSAIQMIGADAFDEMELWFDVVATPTLLHEIISNLKRANLLRKGKRLPIEVLRSTAGLLSRNHAPIPASFRELAVGSILGDDIPMNGVTLPVNAIAGNVHSNGRMLMIDGTKDQELFAAWARGEFKESDERVATLWQDGKANMNMKVIGEQRKPFAKRIAPNARSIEEVISAVDTLMADSKQNSQINLCRITLEFLCKDLSYGELFVIQSALPNRLLFRDFSPYAASILRIFLVFSIALGLELVKRDVNSLADLQYLFYAPFCAGFCSNDNLHKQLFPATSGPAIYLPADTLKADLLYRKAWRKSLGDEGWAKYCREYGIYPMEVEGSLINEVWKHNIKPRPPTPHRVTDDNLDKIQNDPKFWRMMDEMDAMVASSEAVKRTSGVPWPHGEMTDGEQPF